MKTVYGIITQIQNTSGSKAKIQILRDNVDNIELMKFLFFTYEPTISYYQKRVDTTASVIVDETKQFTMQTLVDVYETLGKRNLTGHAAINWLSNLYASFTNGWEKELLVWLIAGDVRAGFSISTTNKVWPNLISDPAYMRCCLPKDVDLENWPWTKGVFSEIKYDGAYANIKIYKNGDAFVESRNGSRFPNEPLTDIIEGLQDVCVEYFFDTFPKENYIVFNGEMEMLDVNGKVLPREKGNGILNSILQTGENTYEETPIYTSWDFQPGKAFEEGIFSMPRDQRVDHLRKAFSNAGSGVKLADIEVCFGYVDAVEEYKKARTAGLEGTVIKHPKAIWKNGTSKEQVKMKEVKDVDLKVVGFKEGSGKYAGMLGSIECESEDGLLSVNVSGVSDLDREEIWNNKEYYMNKILTVTSNGIMEASKAGEKHSLFLPRAAQDDKKNIMWRLDKSVADTYDRIVSIFASK